MGSLGSSKKRGQRLKAEGTECLKTVLPRLPAQEVLSPTRQGGPTPKERNQRKEGNGERRRKRRGGRKERG